MRRGGRSKLRVTLVYLETFFTSGLTGGDRYRGFRLLADLSLGLGSLRAYAERDRTLARRVEMSNLLFTDIIGEEEIVSAILRTSPGVVAFGAYIWNCNRVYKLCRLLKERRPSLRIVVGGPEVPKDPAALRAFLWKLPQVDAAICGEGEVPFSRLLKAWAGGGRLKGVPSLAFREGKHVQVSRPGPQLRQLGRLPSPYAAGAVRVKAGKLGILCVETSRGCPFKCAYCDYSGGRRKIRRFPLTRLKSELSTLRRSGFEGCIYFADPTLNANRKHFLSVLRALRGWPHPVHMELRPESLGAEAVTALAKLSKASIAIGIQSTDPAALRSIHRSFPLEKGARGIRGLLRHPQRLWVELELILGLPGDDYKSFRRSIDWALSFSPPPHLVFFDLVVLPNAPLASLKDRYSIVTDRQGLVKRNYSFSAKDMMRASWLAAAHAYTASDPFRWETFLRELREGERPPSALLEETGQRLLREGLMPRRRIVGQGGRRPAESGRDQGALSDRWVELNPDRMDSGSFGRWWWW